MYRVNICNFLYYIYAALPSLDQRFPAAFAIMKLVYFHHLESTQMASPLADQGPNN